MSSSLLSRTVAGTLGVLSAAHVTWTFSSWPLRDPAQFARAVVGVEPEDAPGAPATLAVAALLAQAAVLVSRCGSTDPARPPGRLAIIGTRTVAGVLLTRAAAGLVVSGAKLGPAPATFRRLDLRVYSPLCLLLGAGAAAVASSARPRG